MVRGAAWIARHPRCNRLTRINNPSQTEAVRMSLRAMVPAFGALLLAFLICSYDSVHPVRVSYVLCPLGHSGRPEPVSARFFIISRALRKPAHFNPGAQSFRTISKERPQGRSGMRALCWKGVNDLRVETVPDPSIVNPHPSRLLLQSCTDTTDRIPC